MASDVKIAIVGDAKKFIAELGAAGAEAEGFGGKLKSLAVIGGAAFAGFAVAAGVELFKVGEHFTEAYDTIRAKTGATGDALSGLEDDFKKVVTTVPTSFGAATDAIVAIKDKIGLTGEPLQHMSEQFLELSRITKTDLTANMQDGTAALNNWQIPAERMPAVLDEMFRASQLTGVSFDSLAQGMTTTGTALQALGFEYGDAIAITGLLGKAGLDVGVIMPALSKSMATAAKEGKSAGDLFQETFDKIKNAPTDVEAAGEALTVFGAKAGPKFAEMIREGKFSYTDLLKSIQGGTDTIIGAGKETQNFGEKWDLIKNQILVAAEPAATALFKAIGDGMTAVTTAFSEGGFSAVMQMIGDNITAAWPAVQAALVAGGKKVVAWIQAEGPVIAAQLVAWGKAFVEWVGPRIPPLLEELGKLLGAFGTWLLNVGLPALVSKLEEWGSAFVKWVAPAIPPLLVELAKLWLEVAKWLITDALPALDAKLLEWAASFAAWVGPATLNMLGQLPGLLGALVGWLRDTALPAIVDAVGAFAVAVLSWIGDAIDAAPGKLAWLIGVVTSELGKLPDEIIGALSGMASALYDKATEWGHAIVDGIKDQIQSIPGMISDIITGSAAGAAAAAGGGNHGGKYTPPTGGLGGLPGFAMGGIVGGPMGQAQLAIVHGGEQVLTPAQQYAGQPIVNVQVEVITSDPNTQVRVLPGQPERAARTLQRALV